MWLQSTVGHFKRYQSFDAFSQPDEAARTFAVFVGDGYERKGLSEKRMLGVNNGYGFLRRMHSAEGGIVKAAVCLHAGVHRRRQSAHLVLPEPRPVPGTPVACQRIDPSPRPLRQISIDNF